jgi:hypothetical protein
MWLATYGAAVEAGTAVVILIHGPRAWFALPVVLGVVLTAIALYCREAAARYRS